MPNTNTLSSAAYMVGATGLTLFLDGKHYAVNKDHPNYALILDGVRAKDWATVVSLVDIPAAVTKWLGDEEGFTLDGDCVSLNGEAFSPAVSGKVLRMIADKFDSAPLFKFLKNVRSNPSYTAQQELLLFCVANGFAITDDGCIIAYKLVREDFMDHYTGKLDNTPGKTVEMSRHLVDDRRDHTCSHGLHFAAFTYANSQYAGGRGKLLAIKVNPTDVVSIPSDYDNQKGRCCKYTVVAEVARQPLPQKEVYSPADIGRSDWGLPDEDCEHCAASWYACTCN